MGEARSKAMEHLSFKLDKYPRDLLQRFMISKPTQLGLSSTNEEGPEEIELNLGLSLGGRFGVDKSAKKLTRSSSIGGSILAPREDDATTPPPASYPNLIRTSSLPTETEEEWRKRKELQTLRRLEAKRRRSVKQRVMRAEKDAAGCSDRCLDDEIRLFESPIGLDLRDKLEKGQQQPLTSVSSRLFGLPTWATAAKQAVPVGGIEANAKGKGGFMGGSGSLQGFVQPSSQGLADSQGGSSSGFTEMESKPVQGSSSGEAKSPTSNQLLQERSNLEAIGSSGMKANESASGAEMENPFKRTNYTENRGKEIGMNAMEDMPCVFTKGNGPNGGRVEGILYKYGKGEEVRIMCVCHGRFLSPAEFVKHAGGGDVAHPLRHIVVNPSSGSL